MKNNVKHFARVTLFAFLLSAILPFFAVYDISAYQSSTKNEASLFGDKILICSGESFKWVSWEDLQSGKEKHHPPSHYQCALCYVAAHGLGDNVKPIIITLAGNQSTGLKYTLFDSLPRALHLHSALHSRAPPSILL